MSLAQRFKRQRAAKFQVFHHQKQKGETGDQGIQGLPGIQGRPGESGVHGPAGPQGDKGEKGPQGEVGPQGARGHSGEDGQAGQHGEQGPMPKHETRGDAIRFEIAPGQWGKWISLSGHMDHQQNLSVGSITEAEVIALIATYGSGDGVDYNVLIDTVGDIKYVGSSLPGTATSASTWSIKRIDLSDTGGDVDVTYANGSADFDKVWDDRATYTYTPTGA